MFKTQYSVVMTHDDYCKFYVELRTHFGKSVTKKSNNTYNINWRVRVEKNYNQNVYALREVAFNTESDLLMFKMIYC